MRTHHPMHTDAPLQMMNSAVAATIQSADEKRRKAPIEGGSFVTFTFALGDARFSYRKPPTDAASAEVSIGNAARARRLARPSSPSFSCSMNDSLFFAQFGGAPVRARATNSLSRAIDRVLSGEPIAKEPPGM